jgi:hypothetical protein
MNSLEEEVSYWLLTLNMTMSPDDMYQHMVVGRHLVHQLTESLKRVQDERDRATARADSLQARLDRRNGAYDTLSDGAWN